MGHFGDSVNFALLLLGSSLKKGVGETLFLELALSGYDLSRLRDDDETTAEMVRSDDLMGKLKNAGFKPRLSFSD